MRCFVHWQKDPDSKLRGCNARDSQISPRCRTNHEEEPYAAVLSVSNVGVAVPLVVSHMSIETRIGSCCCRRSLVYWGDLVASQLSSKAEL